MADVWRWICFAQTRPRRVIKPALDAGFLTDTTTAHWISTPFYASFSSASSRRRIREAVNRIVTRAVENLIQHKLWDAAFELIQRFPAEGGLCQAAGGGF